MSDHAAVKLERLARATRLAAVEPYGSPRRVWVDDGHVFVEGHDGTIVSMTPAVAIEMSRNLGKAGADSLINKIMDDARDAKEDAGVAPVAEK